MITIRKADKCDRHKCVKMMREFRDEYAKTGAHLKPLSDDNHFSVMKDDIGKNIVYLVYLDKVVIGYVDIEYYINSQTGQFHTLGNIINNLYIKKQYRGKGYATLTRKLMMKQYGIVGTNVTVARVKTKLDYWKQQGFKYFSIDSREERTDEHTLIRITTEHLPDYHNNDIDSLVRVI